MREALVVGLGLLAIVVAAQFLAASRASPNGRGVGPQLLVAVVCGLVGALVAAIPYTDAVPDDLEHPGPLLVMVLLAVVPVALLAARRRRRRARCRRSAAPAHGLQ